MNDLAPVAAPKVAERIGTLPPGGAPDQEVADLMNRLSDLQAFLTLRMREGPSFIAAAQTVQDARVLIVERTYPNAMRRR